MGSWHKEAAATLLSRSKPLHSVTFVNMKYKTIDVSEKGILKGKSKVVLLAKSENFAVSLVKGQECLGNITALVNFGYN